MLGKPRAQGLREWLAFKECRKIIEEFLEQLPLFQMLAHRAVRPRHWQDIARLTGARSLVLGGTEPCKV